MKYMLLMYANEVDAPQTSEEHQTVAQAGTHLARRRKQLEFCFPKMDCTRLQMLLRLQGWANDFSVYHAAYAKLLRRSHQREAATEAYRRPMDMCGNMAERACFQRRLDEML